MPFIGTQPDVGGYSVLDALTASATANYTLQLNSANFVPASANQLLVSLNGVIQKPGSSFTVSGSTLTFSSALTSSDSIDFIISMGEPLLIGTPSDNTITTNKLVNDSVTGAKIENNPTIAGNLTVSGTTTATGKITSTAGITFGSDTAAVNVLDDYEEGSFVATMDNSVTIHEQTTLQYTKIGRVVTVSGQIRINATNGGAAVVISNLPFTNIDGAEASEYSIGSVRLYEYNIPSDSKYVLCYTNSNSTKLYFTNVKDNAVTEPLAADQNGYLMFTVTYNSV